MERDEARDTMTKSREHHPRFPVLRVLFHLIPRSESRGITDPRFSCPRNARPSGTVLEVTVEVLELKDEGCLCAGDVRRRVLLAPAECNRAPATIPG